MPPTVPDGAALAASAARPWAGSAGVEPILAAPDAGACRPEPPSGIDGHGNSRQARKHPLNRSNRALRRQHSGDDWQERQCRNDDLLVRGLPHCRAPPFHRTTCATVPHKPASVAGSPIAKMLSTSAFLSVCTPTVTIVGHQAKIQGRNSPIPRNRRVSTLRSANISRRSSHASIPGNIRALTEMDAPRNPMRSRNTSEWTVSPSMSSSELQEQARQHQGRDLRVDSAFRTALRH